MINRYSLAAFAFALALGTSLAYSEKITNLFRHECTHWSKETLARPLFTLEEGRQLLGKRVRAAESRLYPHNAGRIRMLEMVGQDKFFIMVHWEIAPDDGKDSLRFYDKNYFRTLTVKD